MNLKSLKVLFSLMAIVGLSTSFFSPVFAATKTSTTTAQTKAVKVSKPYQYTRIFYYREGKNARKAFLAHPEVVDVFAPQSYSIDKSGIVEGSVAPDLLAFAKANNIRVMPLVTNKMFSQTASQSFLDDPQLQDYAINQLVAEAQKQGYWGWQVDFEQIDFSYRDKFSAFIAKFSSELKKYALISSVAVVAQTTGDSTQYKKSLWQNVIGVYDYASLGVSADIVSIMSYDDPDSGGPVTRYSWFKKVIQYSISLIPEHKVSIGFGLYYWQWNTDSGKRVGIGGYDGINTVLTAHKAAVTTYDANQHAPYIRYTSKGKHYLLWYENGKSVQEKLDLMQKYGLNGFSAWSLGLEVPSVYPVIKKVL